MKGLDVSLAGLSKEERDKCIENICNSRMEMIIERFKTLEPFKSEEDIPMIPIVDPSIYNNVIIPNLIRCGAIPKSELIIGQEYIGDCRNASIATWTGKEFEYKRYKFGSYYIDSIPHFEDGAKIDTDVFVPIKL